MDNPFLFCLTVDIIAPDQPFCCYPFIPYMEPVESLAVERLMEIPRWNGCYFVLRPLPMESLPWLVLVAHFALSVIVDLGASLPYRASLLGRRTTVSGRTTNNTLL